MITFQERLKEIRLSRNFTQKDIANFLKITPSGYAGYEQGYREPDLITLASICKLLNVSADYLLGLSDDD